MRTREIHSLAIAAVIAFLVSAISANAATITITSVTSTSTCVTANANNGNDDEDPYGTGNAACSEPTGGADGNFMRLDDSGTTASTAAPGSSTSIDFDIDAGVAADSAVAFGDEFERGKIRYSLDIDVTALSVEDWTVDLQQDILGLYGFHGDGTLTAVGTQDNGLTDISTINVDVGATDYSFSAIPGSAAQNPSNNSQASVQFSGTRTDTTVASGSGNGSFTVTIAFDIDAFSDAGCSGFICSSASGGEDAAVLLGWDNVDDCCGGTLEGINADNYSEWGRAVGPDGYSSSFTLNVTSECGDGDIDPGEACDEGAITGTDASCCDELCQIRTGGFACRLASDVCDAEEVCDGLSPTCPSDVLEPATVVCRAASSGDLCDIDELCTGSSAACPPDLVEPSGTVCRAATGSCDVAETCDGISVSCPADVLVGAGTECRAVAGICDVAESCDGSSGSCPADGFLGSGVCRSSAGVCDLPESCNGTGADCPVDGFDTGTECRAAVDDCDVAESCDGGGANCPADAVATVGTTCRAAAGVCDVAETCDGIGTACPADAFEPASVVCRAASSGDLCDVDENCTGSSASCPADGFEPAGTVCRAEAGDCDVEETCDGSSASCPADAVEPAATECRAVAGVCDIAEECDGSSAACPADGFDTGTECRAVAGVCDVAESCDGGGPNCPADGFDVGTECRTSTGQCDPAEDCDGLGANCPADQFEPDGTGCDDGIPGTIFDQCTTGVCAGTPLSGNLDAFKCYKAKDLKNPKFLKTTISSLDDQFQNEVNALVKKPFLHCNPTDVEGAGIFNSTDHLVCYKVKAANLAPRPKIEVVDVFGTVQLEAKKSFVLCFPSSKTVLP